MSDTTSDRTGGESAFELWYLRETDPRMMRQRLCGRFDTRDEAEAALKRKTATYTDRRDDYAIQEVEPDD